MEEKKNKFLIKSYKQMFLVIGIFTLVLLVGGTTYAFFNYTRTGSANTLRTGRIYFSTEQTNQNTITLNNVFPMTKEQALADSSTNGTLVVTFNGDTEYTEGMEYLLSIDSVTGTTNVPVSLIMDVNITENNVAVAENSNYYTARDAKTASMYKAEGTDTVINSTTHKVITDIETGKYLLAGYIKSGEYGINGSITIKAFIDADNILITDTPDDQSQRPSTAYTDGTDTTGKTVISTTDWNALGSSGISFKVRGEAREGIWVENPNTLYNAVKAMSLGTMNAGTDFGTVASSDTTNHPYGVYQLVESNLTNPIYFFRGDHAVKNNVIFDDKCWLVVRTTETNSTRILYNGTPVNGKCTTTNGNRTMISLYQSDSVNSDGNYDYSYTSTTGFTTLKSGENFKFNVNSNDAKYVGYTYDNGVNSNMKNALEAWYDGAISAEAKAKVETSTYCNDTTVDSSVTSYTRYMPYTRVEANTPSVVCPAGANIINSKVGFLTVDEEILAGRTWSTGMQDYLYNNSYWWLGSPNRFNSGSANEFIVDRANSASVSYYVNSSSGLRAVVSITSNTVITGGDGSQGTPWIIG